MAAATIDHATLVDLANSAGLGTTRVVAQGSGWTIKVRQGGDDRTLTALRSREVRVFPRMETLVAYLKDLGIATFEVDAADYDPDASSDDGGVDEAHRLRAAHGEADHDDWFRAQVRQAVAEADGPNPGWVDHQQALDLWAEKRAGLTIKSGESA